jgi:hypothetical protein
MADQIIISKLNNKYIKLKEYNKNLKKENRILKSTIMKMKKEKSLTEFELKYILPNIRNIITEYNTKSSQYLIDKISEHHNETGYPLIDYYQICNNHGILGYMYNYCKYESLDNQLNIFADWIEDMFKDDINYAQASNSD